jgi:hypothetical protein
MEGQLHTNDVVTKTKGKSKRILRSVCLVVLSVLINKIKELGNRLKDKIRSNRDSRRFCLSNHSRIRKCMNEMCV